MSLVTRISDLATRFGTEAKSLRTLLNGNQPTNGALTTTAKSNLVAAINELKAEVDAAAQSGGAVINDSAASSSTVYSSQRSTAVAQAEAAAAVAALIGAAPAALDTWAELVAAQEADQTALAALTTGLGTRVRFDAAQVLTAPQQATARANIGAAEAAALTALSTGVGNTDTNFVAVFEAALT